MTAALLPPPSPADALFLDFDGTLADIAAVPDTVQLPARGAVALEALARRLDGALCILSGRSLHDLSLRCPPGLWRAGTHGLDIAPPHVAAARPSPPPQALMVRLLAVCARFPGVRVEAKGPVVAVHYRGLPDIGPSLGAALAQSVKGLDGYRIEAGKMVYEARPEGINKGRALRRLMETPPFAGRRPVAVGDDVTDEDAFRAALDLGGLAVKVGPGPSQAPLRLPGVGAVWDWLGRA